GASRGWAVGAAAPRADMGPDHFAAGGHPRLLGQSAVAEVGSQAAAGRGRSGHRRTRRRPHRRPRRQPRQALAGGPWRRRVLLPLVALRPALRPRLCLAPLHPTGSGAAKDRQNRGLQGAGGSPPPPLATALVALPGSPWRARSAVDEAEHALA